MFVLSSGFIYSVPQQLNTFSQIHLRFQIHGGKKNLHDKCPTEKKNTLYCTAKTDKKEEKKYNNGRERRCIKCIAQLSTSFIKTLNIAFLATLQLARMIRR